jgi:hypothetical protein
VPSTHAPDTVPGQHVTRDGRMRIIVYLMVRLDPRWEPYAGKPMLLARADEVIE